jgi:hypothetical protein
MVGSARVANRSFLVKLYEKIEWWWWSQEHALQEDEGKEGKEGVVPDDHR